MTSNRQRTTKARRHISSLLVQTSATVDVKLYIYGSEQLTYMVQTDIQRMEEEITQPSWDTQSGYWIIIDSDEVE